jgi:hypothetical protein
MDDGHMDRLIESVIPELRECEEDKDYASAIVKLIASYNHMKRKTSKPEKVQYLDDLKAALVSVPDEILTDFGFQKDEDELVSLQVFGDGDLVEKYEQLTQEYPALEMIAKWMFNIREAPNRNYNESEPISSD